MLFFRYDAKSTRFQAAATTRQYLTTVFQNHEIDLVVMEACGPSGWVSDLCQEHGIKTLVCSTNEERMVKILSRTRSLSFNTSYGRSPEGFLEPCRWPHALPSWHKRVNVGGTTHPIGRSAEELC